jgi:uncharacterized DUF497 family protein
VIIEFDPAKSAKNERERGLPFELAADLEWDRAMIARDERFDYREERLLALAPMRGRLYFACYAVRAREGVEVRRIIGFRKANRREERAYEKATPAD